MKRIVIKTGRFPLVSETFITSHIISCLTLDFDVIILVDELKDPKENKQEKIIEKYSLDKKILLEDFGLPKKKIQRLVKGLLLLLQNIKFWKSIFKYLWLQSSFSFSLIYEAHFFLKLRDIDIFHVQYGTNSVPLGVLKEAGIIKAPVIVTFHGHDAFFPINGFIQEEGYYTSLFKNCEMFTANTPFLEGQLIKIGCPRDKIRIIPVPVNTKFFRPDGGLRNSGDIIKILSVGRLEKIKGHEYGIKAISALVRKGFKIKFDIVGEGTCKKDLHELIAELAIENSVELHGAKTQEEIKEFYNTADIFLMTSVDHKNIRETQGLVTLEAQACGVPVVAFDSGGVKYTLKNLETGYLVKERDLEKLIFSIEELIKNFSLRVEMAGRGPKFVKENFSHVVISRMWATVYNDLTK